MLKELEEFIQNNQDDIIVTGGITDEKIFPIWLVPLANDEGGNLFAYSIRNGEEGAIYYYSHEFEYGENPEKYIKYLSKDIDAFLNSLDFEEEEE